MTITDAMDRLLIDMAWNFGAISQQRARVLLEKLGAEPAEDINFLIEKKYMFSLRNEEDGAMYVLTSKGREYVETIVSEDFEPGW